MDPATDTNHPPSAELISVRGYPDGRFEVHVTCVPLPILSLSDEARS